MQGKAFDKSLYVTTEDSIFALEEIPEVQSYSESFDKVLPKTKENLYT